jgi:tetratricopeptide (TPR) repeat protein
MTDSSNSTEMLAFESAVNFFYDKAKNQKINYYELLGIATNATHREIETAYNKYAGEFSQSKVNAVSNPELQKKAQFLVEIGKRAFELLTDFEKRGEYEKLGFKDVDPESLKEIEPHEKAREIYRKAKTLYGQKKYVLGSKAMEEAISFDSTKPDYFHLLGLCQSYVPEYRRDAEVNLKKAAEMEGWNAEHQVALGMLFYNVRLFKRAEAYFRKAVELEPNHMLANKKLRELGAPESKPLDKAKEQLGKIFPTFFGKKKK